MTPFYIIGSLFFIWAILISIYGFKNLAGFQDKQLAPVAAVTLLLFAGTLVSAIWGAIEHSAEHGETGHEVTQSEGKAPQEQQ